MKLNDIFLLNFHKDMPSESRKFGAIIFVCSRVIMRWVLYLALF